MARGARAPVEGTIDPGFERVRTEFERNFVERGELGAAFAVYHRGRRVVDLWGGHVDKQRTKPWRVDSLTTIFSTTKGVSALVLAIAHSRGWLDWEARVADYWPEFAQAGKAEITVRQLLAHQAGLAAIDTPLDPETLGDLDRLASILARQAPAWKPGTRHGYHAQSLGFYENELMRRVEPRGRTIGQFLRDEVAPKLGLELYIGLPDEVDPARLAPVFRESLLDHFRVRGRPYVAPGRLMLQTLRPGSLTARAFYNPKIAPEALQSPPLRKLEIPSGNAVADARSLASFYGVFAMGGGELGITGETLDGLMAEPLDPSEGPLDQVTHASYVGYSLGFAKARYDYAYGSSPGAFGTAGVGGSFAFADPHARVAMAYVMNRMGPYMLDDPREKSLRDATYRALARFGPGDRPR